MKEATAADVAKLALGDINFDPDALKAKYLEERDKRLRDDANEQYAGVEGDFSNYVDDPYEAKVEREPLGNTVEIVIIGGGFGGFIGRQAREAGFDDIRVIEKGGDFGGTWYWNRYPGAMCDVESYCYLPMLEELDYIPKHKYPSRRKSWRIPRISRSTMAYTTTPAFQQRLRIFRGMRANNTGLSPRIAAIQCELDMWPWPMDH